MVGQKCKNNIRRRIPQGDIIISFMEIFLKDHV
jgi:hypothetical protein